jgi:hypothetical protein
MEDRRHKGGESSSRWNEVDIAGYGDKARLIVHRMALSFGVLETRLRNPGLNVAVASSILLDYE